jgi:hypothetical protein
LRQTSDGISANKNFMDKQGYFSSLRTISNCICDMTNSELDRQGYCPFFVKSFDYEYGFACDMRIESHYKNLCEDFYLHDKNYEDLFFSTYMDKKNITLHVCVKEDLMIPMKMDGNDSKTNDCTTSTPIVFCTQP